MNFSHYANPLIKSKLSQLFKSRQIKKSIFTDISEIIKEDVPFIVLGSLFFNPVSRLDIPINARAISPNYIHFKDSF